MTWACQYAAQLASLERSYLFLPVDLAQVGLDRQFALVPGDVLDGVVQLRAPEPASASRLGTCGMME